MPTNVELPTVDHFLRTVLRSGVLTRAQLQDSIRKAAPEQRQSAETLAEHLVATGDLSRFQAGKLLRGMAGGLVLGHYQVLAPLGRGGMGTVYLARDDRSEMLIALKVLPPKRAREEQRLLARFRREMEMCQRVSHPHLAYAYEVGLCQGVYYIALEYIPGKSLYRLVSEEGPLEVARAARLFSEVASALDHAHHQGLIHRDMKPSNIMITPHDHAKVLDLGLALVQGEAPVEREIIGGEGYVVGTMDYIAPEQSENAYKVEPRSDIYAMGCTLYFALTGQPPFPGGTAVEKIHRHRTADPQPIPQLNQSVPPAFIGIVRKMMAKNPEQRFQSAAEVQEKLQPWVSYDKTLPLDQRGDKEYQAAVLELERAEPAPELIAEAIPMGILVPMKETSSEPMIDLAEEEKPSPGPSSLFVFLGSMGIVAIVLLVITLWVLQNWTR